MVYNGCFHVSNESLTAFRSPAPGRCTQTTEMGKHTHKIIL